MVVDALGRGDSRVGHFIKKPERQPAAMSLRSALLRRAVFEGGLAARVGSLRRSADGAAALDGALPRG